MIRLFATFSLALLLLIVLYLPSAHPPEHFIAQIRTEHALHEAFWGHEHAAQVLARLRILEPPDSGASALVRQIADLGSRLGEAPYFQSMWALLLLMSYRVLAFLASVPVLGVFMLVALIDGLVRRAVKSKEFLQHKADLFAVYASLAIVVVCANVIAFAAPFTVHPFLLAFAPLLAGMLASLALAHFHDRG